MNDLIEFIDGVVEVVLGFGHAGTLAFLMLLEVGILHEGLSTSLVLADKEGLAVVLSHVIVKRVFVSELLAALLEGALERHFVSVDSDVILEGIGPLEELSAVIRAGKCLLVVLVHLSVLFKSHLGAEDLLTVVRGAGKSIFSIGEMGILVLEVEGSGGGDFSGLSGVVVDHSKWVYVK